MDGGSQLIRGTLTNWETLIKPYGFGRIHRSTLVNVGRVRAVRPVNAKYFECPLSIDCKETRLEVRPMSPQMLMIV